MLTARRGAPEAARLGFVSDVVPHDELDRRCRPLADERQARPPSGRDPGPHGVLHNCEHDVDAHLQMLQAALTVNLGVSDAREGTTAFAEKRLPAWRTR